MAIAQRQCSKEVTEHIAAAGDNTARQIEQYCSRRYVPYNQGLCFRGLFNALLIPKYSHGNVYQHGSHGKIRIITFQNDIGQCR